MVFKPNCFITYRKFAYTCKCYRLQNESAVILKYLHANRSNVVTICKCLITFQVKNWLLSIFVSTKFKNFTMNQQYWVCVWAKRFHLHWCCDSSSVYSFSFTNESYVEIMIYSDAAKCVNTSRIQLVKIMFWFAHCMYTVCIG